MQPRRHFTQLKRPSYLLLIRDNGIGFDISNAPRGNGLNNMQLRAQEMNAQLNIQSTPSEGDSPLNSHSKLE